VSDLPPPPSVELAAHIVLGYEPAGRSFVAVGLGGQGAFCAAHFFSQATGWTPLQFSGEARNIQRGRVYTLRATVHGQLIQLAVDDVETLSHQMALPLLGSGIGVVGQGDGTIVFSDYAVVPTEPQGFAVMEFSDKFQALYTDVLRPVSKSMGVNLMRADEIPGPGFIISDIVRKLWESSIVVAEITHTNPNVYFEVGYAYALGKPLILLAEKGHQLPFDVAGMRVIFYDDSIGGKARVEAEFTRHLSAILSR